MFTHLSDLDLRLIRVFLAIVDAGGISSAQATLNVGQSTISTQLATLETRLGYRLCERGRGGFALTSRGEQFVEACRALLAAVDTFDMTARNVGKKLVGTLTIGIIGHTPVSRERAHQRGDRAVSGARRVGAVFGAGALAGRTGGIAAGRADSGRRSAISGIACRRWNTRRSLPKISSRIARGAIRCSSRPATSIPNAPPISNGRGAVIRCRKPTRSTPRNITAVADNMEAVAMLVLSGHHLGYLPGHFAAPYVKKGLLAAAEPGADALPRRVPDGHARRGSIEETTSYR